MAARLGSSAYSRGARHADGHSEMVRACLHGLNEGQKIAYDVVADKRTDKSSAENLKPA